MDSTDNQLRACVSALDDVITPAMAAGNMQAAEQAFLVTDYLGYLRSRLDYLHDRNRFEVRHHLDMADAVLGDAETLDPAGAAELADAIADARGVLDDASARDPQLRSCAVRLAAAITAVLRAVASSDDPRRTDLERIVVARMADKIAVDRAWHLPQGLDGDPNSVLSLDEALGITPAAAG